MLLLLKPPTTSIMSSFCSGTSCCPVISYTALCRVCRQHNSCVRLVRGALPARSRGTMFEVFAHALASPAAQSSHGPCSAKSAGSPAPVPDRASWTRVKPTHKAMAITPGTLMSRRHVCTGVTWTETGTCSHLP